MIMNSAKVIWLSVILLLISCHGKSREDSRSACDSGPCMNGGQCIDISYPGGPQTFKCSCKEGYDGLTCQRKIDPCADDPCLNGGICTPRGEHYHCMCLEAFRGKDCEVPVEKKDPCGDKPCGTHGICEVVNGQFVCECLPGFKGPKCELEENEPIVVTVPPTNSEITSWVIKDVLIAILFFIVLFAFLLLLLCCHCYRVWNKSSELKNVQKARKAAGMDPGPTKGWIEISNQLCYDCFCWCFKSKKQQEPGVDVMGDQYYSDPNNVTGVIVPVNEYNNMVRGGYAYDQQMAPEAVPIQNQMKPAYSEHPAPKYVMMPRQETRYVEPVVCSNTIPVCPERVCYTRPVREVCCAPRDYYTCDSPMPPRRSIVTCQPTCMPAVCNRRLAEPMCRDICQNRERHTDHCRVPYQPIRTRPTRSRMCDGGSCSRYSYHNSNSNQEPDYYEGSRECLLDSWHSVVPSDILEKRKVSRSELHAQHGKDFTSDVKKWCQQNAPNGSPRPCYPYSQDTRYGYSNPPQNLNNYPIPMHNGISPGTSCPDYYGNSVPPFPPTTPYPWVPPPYIYPPYAYPYPMHNNIQNNSNSSPTPPINSQEKVQPNEYTDMNNHPLEQQKVHLGQRNQDSDKIQPLSKGQNTSCENSRMDILQFVDDEDDVDDESEPFLTGESGDDCGSAFLESEVDDTETVDDDGYGSTNRLSECNARGKIRDSLNFKRCSFKSPRNYISRKQRMMKSGRISQRSQQCGVSGSKSLVRKSKLSQNSVEQYGNQMNSSDYGMSSNYQNSEESTSDEGKEDKHSFHGTSASKKSGGTIHKDSCRTQQQFEGKTYNTGRLIRRGDLWTNSQTNGSGSQKCLKIAAKNEDSPGSKPSSIFEGNCPTSAPKKIKGILKSNSHARNCNRSASSEFSHKPKETNINL